MGDGGVGEEVAQAAPAFLRGAQCSAPQPALLPLSLCFSPCLPCPLPPILCPSLCLCLAPLARLALMTHLGLAGRLLREQGPRCSPSGGGGERHPGIPGPWGWLLNPQGTRHDASGSSSDWIPGCPPQLSQPLSCCFRAVGSQLPLTFLPRALWEQLEDKGMGECPPLLLPPGATGPSLRPVLISQAA